jgi:hypothetical protein
MASNMNECLPHWPCGLRRRSAAVRLLVLLVRIPPEALMFVSLECCMLSGRGLCDGPISHPDKFYRVWSVLGWSRRLFRGALPGIESKRHRGDKKTTLFWYLQIAIKFPREKKCVIYKYKVLPIQFLLLPIQILYFGKQIFLVIYFIMFSLILQDI